MEFMGFILLGLAVCFYFLPFAICRQRETVHSNQIFLVNLLFGWTILGWIAALIWAIVEKEQPAPETKIDQHWQDARAAARENAESAKKYDTIPHAPD
jgi:RsiW-degrading membrane proteinase PrsW (M82 family)